MTRAPAEGQIWREIDPRKERFIRVCGVSRTGLVVFIETVAKDGDKWVRARGTRRNEANIECFNGNRGGYAYLETQIAL